MVEMRNVRLALWLTSFTNPFYYRADRRAMDRVNKKAREMAKRKYQDTIRALAEFVRKRDPRLQAQRVGPNGQSQ